MKLTFPFFATRKLQFTNVASVTYGNTLVYFTHSSAKLSRSNNILQNNLAVFLEFYYICSLNYTNCMSFLPRYLNFNVYICITLNLFIKNKINLSKIKLFIRFFMFRWRCISTICVFVLRIKLPPILVLCRVLNDWFYFIFILLLKN